MDTILKNLYYGHIFPEEKYRPKNNQYNQRLKDFCEHQENFIKVLEKNPDSALLPAFQSLANEWCELSSDELTEMFIDSFRLGARFMLEILEDKYHYNKNI